MVRVEIWCPDCTGVDFQGCFEGGSDFIEFETREEAESYIQGVQLSSIHRGQIVHDSNRTGDDVYQSGEIPVSPVPKADMRYAMYPETDVR